MLDQAVQGENFGIAQCLANVLLWGFWTLSRSFKYLLEIPSSWVMFNWDIYHPLLLHWNTNARAPLFAHVHLATPRGVPHPTRLGPWLPMIQTNPEWPARQPLLHWCGRPPAEPKQPAETVNSLRFEDERKKKKTLLLETLIWQVGNNIKSLVCIFSAGQPNSLRA
jgi:hypothetical protein